MLSFLAERTLRLLDLLTQTGARFGILVDLTTSLVPHFLGLTLPVAFFLALFVVITGLDGEAEITALLASGTSLHRIARPLLCVGLVLGAFSIVLFGYLQPYSRYAFRAAFHVAANAGWNGDLAPGQVISDGPNLITADDALPNGRGLERIFFRRADANGEDIFTARSAELNRNPDGRSANFVLHDGTQLRERHGGETLLSFQTYSLNIPLAGAAKLLRARGGDQRELTLDELVREAARPHPFIARNTVLAEIYARLARSLVLPFLPLLAFPLGLAAKRAGRTAGLIAASVLLLAFEYGVQFGQSFAEARIVPAGVAIGLPFGLFAAFCVWMFVGSGRRPGETPLSLLLTMVGDRINQLIRRVSRRFVPQSSEASPS